MQKIGNKLAPVLVSLVLVLSGIVFAPIQVSAEDNVKDGDFFFGDSIYVGNIFDLTGVDRDSFKDGIAVSSYKESKNEVDGLKASHDFDSDIVVGYANINGAEIVLLNGPDSITELLFWQNKVDQHQLYAKTLGVWNSIDGATRLEVSLLQFLAPASDLDGGFQTLSLIYMSHEYRSPSSGYPAAVARVYGYLDPDTMQFISAYDCCYPQNGTYNLKSWYSTAANYGSSIYAGCDGHWTRLWFNYYHGAWVTINNYGAANHGGY